MVVRHRRSVPPPAPSPAPGPSAGPVRFIEGAFEYLRFDRCEVGEFEVCPARFKAVFAADPQGCYGFGDTEAEAEAMLRRYAALHEDDA